MIVSLHLCLIIVLVGLLYYIFTKKPINYPPGPSWIPMFGSALTIMKMRKDNGGYLYQAMIDLAKVYGSVVGLKVGKDMQVFCNDYDSIKEMLTKDELDGRPTGSFYEDRTWGKRRGLLLTDEEVWIEQRRFVLRQLKEFGFGRRTMAELVENEAEHLIDTFYERVKDKKNGLIMEMSDAFGVNVLNTLWMMMAGIRYNHEDKELKTLQKLLTELFISIDMVGTLFSQFPFLKYIAPTFSGYTKFIKTHQRLWHFLRIELEQHKETFKIGEPRDLMDVYLQTLYSDKCTHTYSEDQLLAICMDMFMAGSETTTKSLGFAFLYMLLHSDVQQKAKEEIDKVVGRNRLPNMNDRPNLPYIECIMLESLRMFMGRTFTIPHRALKDTTLQGYFVPKNTMVTGNFNGVLMAKKHWGDPEIFRPERFLDENGKVSIPEYFLPFGFGKHRCLGQTLARANIFMFIASMMHRFDFSIPPGTVPPGTKGLDGVTASTGKFHALVTIRE